VIIIHREKLYDMDEYECCSCDGGYTWYAVPHAINTSVSGVRMVHARSLPTWMHAQNVFVKVVMVVMVVVMI